MFWKGLNSEENQIRVVKYLKENPVKIVVVYLDGKEAGFGNLLDLQFDYPLIFDYLSKEYAYYKKFGRFRIYKKLNS